MQRVDELNRPAFKARELSARTWGRLESDRMSKRLDLDTELMLRFQSGDVSSFEKLVERHKQRVFNLVYRFLGGREEAEDLAQDVFLRVYRAGPDYRPTARFTTWLYVITRNVCLRAVEKGRQEARARRDDPQFAMEAKARRQADEQRADPLNAAIRDEQACLVRDAINELPETQRMAVILYRYQHLLC